jgi:hypothetical protein
MVRGWAGVSTVRVPATKIDQGLLFGRLSMMTCAASSKHQR